MKEGRGIIQFVMDTLTNFKFDSVALTEVIIISKLIKTISEMKVTILNKNSTRTPLFDF